MFFERTAARLRAQDGLAITIELAIVIIGVFVGTQVANWNEDRLERREAQRMLLRLEPELADLVEFYASVHTYIAITRAYTATADAGWRRDPQVSDRDFVIAAYQASQIYGIDVNNATWATIFGADRLRTIEDPELRRNLAVLMYSDTTLIDSNYADTPYRQNVRRIIPVVVQDLIRKQCGDKQSPHNSHVVTLSAVCDVELPAGTAASVAAALRDHAELLDDLQWHAAASAAQVFNLMGFEKVTARLQQQIAAIR